jgi:CDP-2,3-bis-(O-geranylgeranyl)-sn-glycerol synthase
MEIFWLIITGGLANMLPVLFKQVELFNYPLDFGLSFNGRRILGDHKTFRGLFFGLFISYIFATLLSISNIIWLLGACGALGGDIIKSFVKRRLDIHSGKSWQPWDSIDWVIGILLLKSILIKFEIVDLLAIPVGYVLHRLVKIIGYYAGYENNKI